MISPSAEAYLKKLRALAESIKDKFQYEVFVGICIKFKAYKDGKIISKNVTKNELIERLISLNLMSYTLDKATGLMDKLPDDRPIRKAVEELIKRGAPIVATSKQKGYYIADSTGEITLALQEDSRRNMSIFEKEKGRKKAIMFIQGQTEINFKEVMQ